MTDPLERLSDAARGAARKVSMPRWMAPMLAKLTHDHFSDPDWIFERKLDGERILALINSDGSVRLMTRNQRQINDSYPEIEEALARQAPPGCILDGEVVAFGDGSTSDFERLQPRMHNTSRKAALKSDVAVYYYLFDCMYISDHNITEVPLRERKNLLREAIAWADPIRFMQHRNEKGEAYLREACESGWEGLIAKEADGPYIHGRSGKWLKFKCNRQQEFVIGGYTEPRGERVGLGALLLGFYRDGDFVYAGKVGTGLDNETLEELHDRLQRDERKTSPFDVGEVKDPTAHFVTPKLVCEVGFSEWTRTDKLRHPRYLGLRRDKEPQQVRREEEQESAP